MALTNDSRQTRLRGLGVLALLLGALGATLVGFRGFHSANPTEDPVMANYYREKSRQAEIMYGSVGVLANDLGNALKRPPIQAGLIAGVSVLFALGCFLAASLAEAEAAQTDQPTPREGTDSDS